MVSDEKSVRLDEAFVAADHFQFQGPVVSIEHHGYGRIHNTFKVVSQKGEIRRQWVLQQLNQAVLSDLEAVTHNMVAVTRHLRQKRKRATRFDPVLTPVANHAGGYLHQTKAGHAWRAFVWIDGRGYEKAERPEIAHTAARTVGRFHADLVDYNGPSLATTISDFHHTAKRLEQLDQAVAGDAFGRLEKVAGELAAVDNIRCLAETIPAAELPQRIVHNDPKLTNILFDQQGVKALCLIDFDTVMPGTILHDFGDMVRAMTNCAGEGARPEAVSFDATIYNAVEQGYLSVMGALLTPYEKVLLPKAGLVLAFELGVRFLTDFLDGDRYFSVTHPDDNLNRCRVQLALLKSMQAKLTASLQGSFFG